jgi:predicted small secreted protein
MASGGAKGNEMYIKIRKVFSYEPVLLRWAMWPMGLLFVLVYLAYILLSCNTYQAFIKDIIYVPNRTLFLFLIFKIWSFPVSLVLLSLSNWFSIIMIMVSWKYRFEIYCNWILKTQGHKVFHKHILFCILKNCFYILHVSWFL